VVSIVLIFIKLLIATNKTIGPLFGFKKDIGNHFGRKANSKAHVTHAYGLLAVQTFYNGQPGTEEE
jgi:hypothetical protein